MSGPTPTHPSEASNNSPSRLSDEDLVAAIRAATGLTSGVGPTDANVLAAAAGFEHQFTFWYTRVIRCAVPQFHSKIIARINPFIRRMQCEGMSPQETASLLVHDYNARNYVTAGGWTLEAMARGLGSGRKSAARGIDIERFDPEENAYHLYVVKSGPVTRNSDILAALKKHARDAHKLLRQGGSDAKVVANYAIAAGSLTTTFEDGIRRPSSAQFWSEITGLDAPDALDLVTAIAAHAARRATSGSKELASHLGALEVLVCDYIQDREDSDRVDWEFIAQRVLQEKSAWKAADTQRRKRALVRLAETGYDLKKIDYSDCKPR